MASARFETLRRVKMSENCFLTVISDTFSWWAIS